MKSRSKMPKKTKMKPGLLWILLVMLVVVAGVYAYAATRPAGHALATPSPTPSVPMGGHGADTTVHAGPSHDATPTPTAATPTPVTNPDHPVTSTLAQPTGQILNTGKASMSDTMESTCNTVAGATCYVQATMGGQTVALSAAKAVSDSGGVIIDWPASKLSAGTWSVELVASKDGATSYSDAQSLVVTP